ncbi:helix-turn-helix domain-containing protein [Saccharothrix longispora]|uniref:helix-turn-helix domain-containing protein n=1 Tax=Saccharothrix longispora TaxID=33920 RepID=UPI0028FD5CEC|nr:helix-turn-helix domain-containing protein [Saccharothrix longispora]MBY8851563.1 LuxR C-terminal-related transcriptional regulator [Saccharothrix sp. MB29]MDU0287731.1 helix-turn-helix domain-containing protein [Saccharothrix longispora]
MVPHDTGPAGRTRPARTDLSPVDLDVYRALLDGPGTAAELGHRLGVGARRLGPVLRRLVDLELATRVEGRPVRFGAVAPEVAFGGLLVRKQRELEEVRLLRAELRERHRRAVGGADPEGLLEVVRGADAIARRASRLVRSARHEVRFVDKPPHDRPPAVPRTAERELLERGVGFRGVYDRACLERHAPGREPGPGLPPGEEARVVPDAPLKMILVDRHLGLVPLESAAPEPVTALVVRPCALLDALGALFEGLWSQALPLAAHDHEPLSEQDARLLALLATGMPDRGIAEQLGLSYRTFQRRLHDLMRALGARTRLQAGVRAAAKGWVRVAPPDDAPG